MITGMIIYNVRGWMRMYYIKITYEWDWSAETATDRVLNSESVY